MAVCKQCGHEYVVYASQGIGICNECYRPIAERKAKDQAEARQREREKEEQARRELPPALFAKYAPNRSHAGLGVAYWDIIPTTAARWKAKVTGAVSLGGSSSELAGHRHRIGLMALCGEELLVVDLGECIGEELDCGMLQSATGPARAAAVPLAELSATAQTTPKGCTVELRGPVRLKAMFPACFDEANPGVGTAIARAVLAAAGGGR